MAQAPTLRDLRIQSGKSVKDVAQSLGITDRALYNYEKGYRQIDISLIIPLSRIYECTAEEIIEAQLLSYISVKPSK